TPWRSRSPQSRWEARHDRALRRAHHGSDRGRRLPTPGRRVPARGGELRQVPRRQPHQRGRGRGPLRPPQRGHHPHRPGPVRRGAARRPRRAARGRAPARRGRDPWGEYLHDALRGFGVDDRFVSAVPGLPTPVTFCEIFPPDDFPLYFYRYPKAPDLEIRPEELDLDAIRAARVFWVTVTGLSQEPRRSATLHPLETRAKSGI